MNSNVSGHFASQVSSWRRLSTATWRAPNDPTIYGTFSVDATAALEYLRRPDLRARHVTITHLATKAVADTLALHPDCNAYIRHGRLFVRHDVDVFVLVAVPPDPTQEGSGDMKADLTGVKIEKANEKSVVEIADEIAVRAAEVRHGVDRSFSRIKSTLDHVPPWLLKPALGAITFAQYELNLDLSRFGVPRDSFGGAFVTAVGVLGIHRGFAPLIPMARLAANLAVGQIADAAVVENGKVVVRPMLPLAATFDHRVIDGYQAGKLGETFTGILRDPSKHWDEPKHERRRTSHERPAIGSPRQP